MEEAKDQEIKQLIEKALTEDIRSGDITSEACLLENETISGSFLLKQEGRVAGLPFLKTIFQAVNPSIEVDLQVKEGADLRAGTVLATVYGSARDILSAERVALNFLQHMSGIATTTKKFVNKVRGFDCDILDTRKTLPGMRHMAKYAVRIGGGKNHRFSLNDRFLIKDNHLSFLATKSTTPILDAVQKARAYRPHVPIEVEVENMEMLEEALQAQADIIMLDNMDLDNTRQAVNKVQKKAYVEASGGITLDTVRNYAETGVNGISIGKLTHSVEALDISLRF